MHDESFLHGDIKGDNLIVKMGEDGADPHVVIIDYGSSATFGVGEHTWHDISPHFAALST